MAPTGSEVDALWRGVLAESSAMDAASPHPDLSFAIGVMLGLRIAATYPAVARPLLRRAETLCLDGSTAPPEVTEELLLELFDCVAARAAYGA